MTYLLDTSALLAHAFHENGWEKVELLLNASGTTTGISVLSVYEADRRLVAIGMSPEERREFARQYRLYLDRIVPLDAKIAAAACRLRELTTARVATVDVLIAATAKVHGAVLVHRDAHFAGIPSVELTQLVLPEK